MNLIRATLLAVFAFMGTVSLSAQQNWLPAPQAIVVITNELDNLANPPAPPASGGTIQSKQQLSDQFAKSGCQDCMLHAVKEQFLFLTLKELKSGVTDTGAAVESVRALMIQGSNNNGPLLSTIQTAYQYMDSIL